MSARRKKRIRITAVIAIVMIAGVLVTAYHILPHSIGIATYCTVSFCKSHTGEKYA